MFLELLINCVGLRRTQSRHDAKIVSNSMSWFSMFLCLLFSCVGIKRMQSRHRHKLGLKSICESAGCKVKVSVSYLKLTVCYCLIVYVSEKCKPNIAAESYRSVCLESQCLFPGQLRRSQTNASRPRHKFSLNSIIECVGCRVRVKVLRFTKLSGCYCSIL